MVGFLRSTRQMGIARRLIVGGPFAFVILVCALDLPLDNQAHVRGLISGRGLYTGKSEMTAGVYRGLIWIRDNTPVETVLAVNNYYLWDQLTPRYFYYSAFSERSIFLEGWAYSNKSFGIVGFEQGKVQPFPNGSA